VTICGKTGTAQNPHGKDHSLFVAFAPRENPKIAIAVMVENAGFGATWAAPIASLLMEKYLQDSVKRHELEDRMLKGFLLPLQNKTLEKPSGVLRDSASVTLTHPGNNKATGILTRRITKR
jgi:penicillin-binding protein 2